MKYKIGDVSKLLGITSEAIRYYEDQGIVNPTKSKSSGYRYYGVWDIHILIRARTYRQYGYSLSETADLINRYDLPDIVSNLHEKEMNIEKQIAWYFCLLKHIREMQDIIKDVQTSQGKYRMEYRPAIYRIDVQDGYELRPDNHTRELYQSWINKVPFAFPSALFPKSWFEKDINDFTFGLVINEEYADLLNIKQSNDIVFYSPCLCVYTTLQTNSNMVLSFELLAPAIDYIHSLGMKVCGDIISRVGLMNKKGNTYQSWHQIWLPVK